MTWLRELNSRLPFEVAIAGRKRNLIFAMIDPLFSRTTQSDIIRTRLGSIKIDATQAPERWLSYAFFNIMNFYARSPLGQYMAQDVGPRLTFVDVGANLGVYSLVAKSLGYATYLVEPEPHHASFLIRNTEVFGKVISAALADKPGTMPLFYEEGNSGATSLVPAKGYRQGAEGISVRTFSSLAAEGAFANPADIHLVKIDVEGAEAQTALGMRNFLDLGHRPVIWCEVRGDLSGRAPGTFRAVTSIFETYGYTVSEFAEGRRKHIGFSSELANRGVFDLLFEPNTAPTFTH
jgi:FkbM family methyltransferase